MNNIMMLSDLIRFVKDIRQMDLDDAIENKEFEGIRMYLVGVEESLKAIGYDACWISNCVSPLLIGTYLKGSFYDDGNPDLENSLSLYYGSLADLDIQKLSAAHGDVESL